MFHFYGIFFLLFFYYFFSVFALFCHNFLLLYLPSFYFPWKRDTLHLKRKYFSSSFPPLAIKEEIFLISGPTKKRQFVFESHSHKF